MVAMSQMGQLPLVVKGELQHQHSVLGSGMSSLVE